MAGEREPERVLIFAPIGRDAAVLGEFLLQLKYECRACLDVRDFCRQLAQGAGTAVITEEVLGPPEQRELAAVLARQGPWSDFPLIVLSGPTVTLGPLERPHALSALGNVIFLQRPVRLRALQSAVEMALRGRRRQYEARRAIEQRDQFLAMLGHELRNPLGAILFAAQTMKRRASHDSRVEKQQAVIDRQARHLTSLVDDLLDVSRVTSGKVTLKRVPLDVRETLRRSVQLIGPAAQESGIELYSTVPDRPVMVEADEVRLEQVFNNILTNAVKYTSRGGSVFVSMEGDGSETVIRIRDTGIGIPPEMLERIFDLFTQIRETLDRSQGGMGIGLTLARSLVELHGGRIMAHSLGLHRGSEFAVRLPLLPEASTAQSIDGAHSAAPLHLRKKIVLVEDTADVREGLKELLEDSGHVVDAVEDGTTGLDRIVATRPDAAIVDIGLPGLNGLEVAKRVRKRLGSNILLVALTGYGQPEDRARSHDAGFDAHLTKPVDLDVLEEILSGSSETVAGEHPPQPARHAPRAEQYETH